MIGPHFDCYGGISIVSKILYEYLISKKYQILYLESTVEGSFLKKNIYTLYSYLRFMKIVFTKRIILIHIHCASNTSFYRKSLYVILSNILRKKILFHIHPEEFFDFYSRSSKFIQSIIINIFHKIIAIVVLADSIKNKIERILPDKKIFVLNNPVECSKFKCLKIKKRNEILYMGWIIPEKGVYDIVEIIPYVIEKHPLVKFVFCGTKEIEKLKLICKNKSIEHNVDIKGWISEKEKTNLLSRSLMLLLPSYSEGLPNVLLEAMASCLPIITTPVGAIPEIIEHEINGFLISPGDREALKEKILLLLNNPALCQRMGRVNKKLVREKYDIEIIGKNLLNIYSQI